MINDIIYQLVKPDAFLADYVESFWLLQNKSTTAKQVVILPDGRIDLFFSRSALEPFHASLLGISTHPEQVEIASGTIMFAISLKPLGAELLLGRQVAGIINSGKRMPDGFWELEEKDLEDFKQFCEKASSAIKQRLPEKTDERKKKLFELIHTSNGSVTIKDLSDKLFWTNRQLNRYFSPQFGLPLKAYCNIIRFRASFHHIKEGKLYPQQDFADQSHFIKEVKKLSGVLPKELNKNKNGKFIQLALLSQK
ncbi:MAG: transcriptional regulator [Sphingobacteriales bacterium SCN 48-20]|uniref:helix-turn-helix domain-containing protein n=1 Tax=Terrimonas ferruginea TaxID=249 RepID=UPI00086A5114|nr:AraC family transcriptional regulator [Terrimonas ferruginea]MBN8782029.1 helix-turn-helix transcriptional regulator [Terrimonas ferruginea]ODT92370.1 MAG: transcriptional regulator [Sphingobacteriales bacterium SCN 48-20]OJW45160.1 MAG: transcriptional regulator [Sphingobacteriales bacterium 48-107]